MVVVLLLPCGEGSQRQKLGQISRKWKFPEPPWLHNELTACNFNPDAVRPLLTRVDAGVPYTGVMTTWDRKTWLWWNFLDRPADAYTILVDSRFVFRGPELQRLAKYARHLCFQWQLPELIDTLHGTLLDRHGAQENLPVQELLERWGLQDRKLLTILAPSKLLFFIQQGLFRSVLVLHRWRVGIKKPKQIQIIPGFPQAAWRETALPISMPVETPKLLTCEKAATVGAVLREHCQMILNATPEEDRHIMHLRLEESLRSLDAHAALDHSVSTRSAYDAEEVVRAVCLSAHLRHRGSLRDVLHKAIPLLFPGQDPKALAEMSLKRTASKTSVHRYQLVVDAALCVSVRERFSSGGPGLVWLWCDSSPQAGEA